MRKWLVLAAMFVFLSLGWTNSGRAAQVDSFAVAAKEAGAPVYAWMAGRLENVGKLDRGEAFEVVGEDEQHYVISFGFVSGMVKKTDVTKVRPPAGKRAPNKWRRSVITLQDAEVYVFDRGAKQAIGMIRSGVRYPVKAETRLYYLIEIGGRDGYVYKHVTENDYGVPVLLYHHILDDFDEPFFRSTTTVPFSQFAREMTYLKENGYTAITPEALLAYVRKEQLLPPKSVLITFDDGLKSTYIYAYPLLKRYGFPATVFMITGRMRPAPQPFDPRGLQFLSKQEIAEMRDVISFESHTNHFHLSDRQYGPYLLFKPYEEAMADLKASKEKIGATAIAYPFGAYNGRAVQMVKQAGFVMAFTTKKGTVYPGDSPFELKRQWVYPHISLKQFERLLRP